MAKIECTLKGDFDRILKEVSSAVEQGSISATLEDGSDVCCGDTRCAVRVWERFSYTGQNRVSLSVTMLEKQGNGVYFVAIASGGSQAMFLKLNTFGEEAFLNTIIDTVERFKA